MNDHAGLSIVNNSQQDGGHVAADSNQHVSSFFEIIPVDQGQWAGKACYIKTFCGKAFDLDKGHTTSGTDILQWSFHGHDNQIWVITPAQIHQQQPQKVQSNQGFAPNNSNTGFFPPQNPNIGFNPASMHKVGFVPPQMPHVGIGTGHNSLNNLMENLHIGGSGHGHHGHHGHHHA